MSSIDHILKEASSVLLVDWPGEDCPRTLVRAGLVVFGQEPNLWLKYEVEDYQLKKRPLSGPPKHVDLVFCYRPIDELREYVNLAQNLKAKTFWYQSGLASADTEYLRGCWLSEENRSKVRRMVEDAGLAYIDEVYIGDAVRALDLCKPHGTAD